MVLDHNTSEMDYILASLRGELFGILVPYSVSVPFIVSSTGPVILRKGSALQSLVASRICWTIMVAKKSCIGTTFLCHT